MLIMKSWRTKYIHIINSRCIDSSSVECYTHSVEIYLRDFWDRSDQVCSPFCYLMLSFLYLHRLLKSDSSRDGTEQKNWIGLAVIQHQQTLLFPRAPPPPTPSPPQSTTTSYPLTSMGGCDTVKSAVTAVSGGTEDLRGPSSEELTFGTAFGGGCSLEYSSPRLVTFTNLIKLR